MNKRRVPVMLYHEPVIVERVLHDRPEPERVLVSADYLFEPDPYLRVTEVIASGGILWPSVVLPKTHWNVQKFSLDHDLLIVSDVLLEPWAGFVPSITVEQGMGVEQDGRRTTRAYGPVRRRLWV